MSAVDRRPPPERSTSRIAARHVVAVRPGRGANCSSLGSSIDALLGGAVAVTALVAAAAAALARREASTVATPPGEGRSDGDDDHDGDEGRGGVWVRVGGRAEALVRLDADGARALGLGAANGPLAAERRRLEVHVAVTERCAVGCTGCYLDARPEGHEPSRDEVESRFAAAAAEGAFVVALGGGEPTLRDDLGELADAARARGLSPVLTTSGLGMGPKKLDRLQRFDQVNVSFDGTDDAYRDVRGVDGAAEACATITALVARGIRVGVNVVLTSASLESLEATLRAAHDAGATEAQLLRYKPAGRAARLDYLAKRLTPAQVDGLRGRLAALRATLPGLALRIDCALVPFVLGDDEAPLASRAGVLGCEAGRHLAARDAQGRVRPCSFHAPPAPGDEVGALVRASTHPDRAPEPCASCALRAVCRGGCRVVATFLGDPEGADPECPRVRAHHGARSTEAAAT